MEQETEMQTEPNQNMPVTQDDVSVLSKQRELLKAFVHDQLVEGIDNDYAVIPGTKKKSLLKPGAEKLARLFSLGVRIFKTGIEIDRHQNFAMYTYKAKVYRLQNPDVIIAECEASCNSQEKKYRERTGSGGAKEETPIFDILNTLQKMSQKRAIVGGVILAVAGSDFFSQDMDDADERGQNGGKPAPKRVSARIPRATSAKSEQQSHTGTPTCCGRPMMVSKYPDKTTGEFPFYCTVCKETKEQFPA